MVELSSLQERNTEQKSEQMIISYDDILDTEFKLVLNSDIYKNIDGKWIDYSNDTDYMRKLIKKSLSLKVVGIIKP